MWGSSSKWPSSPCNTNEPMNDLVTKEYVEQVLHEQEQIMARGFENVLMQGEECYHIDRNGNITSIPSITTRFIQAVSTESAFTPGRVLTNTYEAWPYWMDSTSVDISIEPRDYTILTGQGGMKEFNVVLQDYMRFAKARITARIKWPQLGK